MLEVSGLVQGTLGWVEGNEPELRLVFRVSLNCSREILGCTGSRRKRGLSALF